MCPVASQFTAAQWRAFFFSSPYLPLSLILCCFLLNGMVSVKNESVKDTRTACVLIAYRITSVPTYNHHIQVYNNHVCDCVLYNNHVWGLFSTKIMYASCIGVGMD